MKQKKKYLILPIIAILCLLGVLSIVAFQVSNLDQKEGAFLLNSLETPKTSIEFEQDVSLADADASFIGDGIYNKSGTSIAGAGDINGDGYDDILIGAPEGNEGKVYIFFGNQTGNWSPDMSLTEANASFLGEFDGDRAGSCVASAGNINNDAYDDIIIAASGYDGNTGKVYLIFGNGTESDWTMDMSLGNADGSFIGEHQNHQAGSSLAGIGDLNNDTYDDILIGARTGGSSQEGETYLIYGNQSNYFSINMSLSNANASFEGENAYDLAGASVAGAGDINNDGYNDILIGAPHFNASSGNEGKTYIYFGNGTESDWTMDMSLATADASFIGESEDDDSGSSVAGAGDINNDGYNDILIGAPNLNDARTYLIFGNGTKSDWTMDMSLGAADASFIVENTQDGSGSSIEGAGDINNDGFDDVLISAPDYDTNSVGQSYLIFGNGTESDWTMDMSLGTADGSYIGEADWDYSGSSVAGAGDINNDGCDDVLIGACVNDDGGTNAGKTYLLFGNKAPRFEPRPDDLSFLNDTTGHEIAWLILDDEVNNPNYTIYNITSGTVPLDDHINQPWNPGNNITLTVNNFTVGSHILRIVVWDGMGYTNEDEVNITVTTPCSSLPSPNPIIPPGPEPVEIPGFPISFLTMVTLTLLICTIFYLKRRIRYS
jgi:flavodoxin